MLHHPKAGGFHSLFNWAASWRAALWLFTLAQHHGSSISKFLLALTVCIGGPGPVWALTTSAVKDLTCAGFRAGGGLNCTAGEFTVTPVFSAAPGTPPFCVAGSNFNFKVELGLSGTNTDRMDIGFFVGQQGNDPRASTPGNICSVATFPKTPLPWKDSDQDACGDFQGGGNQTTIIDEIKVVCAGDTNTGALAMPYVLTYWQNNGSVCTGPGNVTNGAPSKCNAGTGLISGTYPINVGAYIDVTKATLPASNSGQSFTFTATGPAGSKVGALIGNTYTPDNTAANTPTNKVTVSVTGGQTVRFFINALTAAQTLTITEAETTGWETAASAISCASATGAPSITTDLAGRSISASMSLANSAASCTFTNLQSARVTLEKSVGGRVKAGDQFTVSASGGGTLKGTAFVTTSGTATNAATTFYSTPGKALTLDDLAVGTSVLEDYDNRLTCTNALSGTAGYTANASLPSNQAASSAIITPVAGDDIACRYTNTPRPRISLQKAIGAAGGGRVRNTDQFSLSITGVTPVLTTGTGAAIMSAPVAVVAIAGSVITLAETAALTTPATELTNYSTTYACTNTGTGGTTVAAGSGTSFSFTPANNDVLVCTFTNTRKSGTLSLRKTWSSTASGDTATVSSSGFINNASSGKSTNNKTNTDAGTVVTVYAGETASFSETFDNPASSKDYTASLSCTGNATPLSAGSLTVHGNDTAIICTLTNTQVLPPNTLSPNGQQTARPGTVVFYAHTFHANNAGSLSLSLSSAALPSDWTWSQVLYQDTDCSATLEETEPQVTGALSVMTGQTLCLMVKQFVPAGISFGAQNTTTLSAAFTNTSLVPAQSSVTLTVFDLTLVGESSALVLSKRVSNITKGSASATMVSAGPGDTLQYSLTAVNNGITPLSTLVIDDTTPAFTSYLSAACPTVLPAVITACSLLTQPAVGMTGNMRWSFTGTLAPSGQVVVTYQVKVNN